MMKVLLILFLCIICFFGIHFISLYITGYIRKKRKEFSIKIGNQITISTTYDPSIMVSIYRYVRWYIEEEMNNNYSHSMSLTYGGIIIHIKYGHNPIEDDNYCNDFCKSKNYGLYSIDGEKLWRSIWWGNHIYDNPFVCTKFLGTYVFDSNTGKLIDKNLLTSYHEDYDPNLEFPYYFDENNVTYLNKDNQKQNIPRIHFWIEERSWCPPILYVIGLKNIIKKRCVDLEFECIQNGDKDFNGIGRITNDWKGGVYGGAALKINDDIMLYNMYNAITNNGQHHLINDFNLHVIEKINDFLSKNKKY